MCVSVCLCVYKNVHEGIRTAYWLTGWLVMKGAICINDTQAQSNQGHILTVLGLITNVPNPAAHVPAADMTHLCVFGLDDKDLNLEPH